MGKLITISQSLLDVLKWLMEGNNWLFLTPVVLISAYVLFKMIIKKETFLMFIWYLATISILSMMLELALGIREAVIFVLVFVALYLFLCLPPFFRKLHIGKKGKHAISSRSKKNRSK
ncbi:MAG: hypothetical protein IC227_09320 [Enterococcus lacertideformus]|uniref:Uncharacterized protein n=1 Tax=Enterococcus lacertideformus TaxID=2771493 RepID=A0A931FC80_9ENTE|nr:hypothetical protein [Enterococcus lacertideformus]